MISYYELLGIIKEGNEPKKIKVEIVKGTPEIYKAEYDREDFSYYLLDRPLQNENYRFYLSECFLESNMFDKCITILDEENEFEDIEEVDLGILNDQSSKNREFKIKINQLIKNQKKIIEKLKENDN